MGTGVGETGYKRETKVERATGLNQICTEQFLDTLEVVKELVPEVHVGEKAPKDMGKILDLITTPVPKKKGNRGNSNNHSLTHVYFLTYLTIF